MEDDYSTIFEDSQPSLAAEEPEREAQLLDVDVQAVTEFLAQLKHEAPDKLKQYAAALSLAMVIPAVFDEGVESVKRYLAGSTGAIRVSAQTIYNQLGAGFCSAYSTSAGLFLAHCPGMPIMAVAMDSAAHAMLLAALTARLAEEGGPVYQMPTPVDSADSHGEVNARKVVVFNRQPLTELQALSPFDTLDLSGVKLAHDKFVTLKDTLLRKTTAAMLFPTGVTSLRLGANTVTPGSFLEANYGPKCEARSNNIRDWVRSLPSEVFTKVPEINATPVPNPVNVPPPGEDCGAASDDGYEVLRRIVLEYGVAHNWNNASAPAYFPEAVPIFQTVSHSGKRKIAGLVSSCNGDSLRVYYRTFLRSALGAPAPKDKLPVYAAFLLARTCLLSVDKVEPHYIKITE